MMTKISFKFSMFFLMCLLLVSSCHKVEVEEPTVQGAPVFMVEAQLGNSSLSLTAGNNGCVLNVGSELLNGVQLFTGSLCEGSDKITLKIFDGKLDMPESRVQNFLENDQHYFFNEPTTLTVLDLENFPNEEYIHEIKWFVDGVQKGINNVVFDQPGKYEVCALVTFQDGTQETVCNDMIIGFEKSALALVRHYVDQQGYLHAWVDSDFAEVSSVKWKLDGTEVSTNQDLLRHVSSQTHILSAEITMSNGVVRSRNVLIDGAANGRFLDDFTLFENMYKGQEHDFNVVIEVEHNGITYSSEEVNNETSVFHVTDVKYFGLDAAGKKVYKIVASVSSILQSVSGNQLPFQGTISFGVLGE